MVVKYKEGSYLGGKKFFSFLGASDYKECCYQLGETITKTKFIQTHLIKACCSDWNENDQAVIFATDFAEACNWENKQDHSRRLKDILNDLGYKLRIKIERIPDGKNKQEIWEIFDIMIRNIDEGDEVIFDITHSFRYIPMLAMVVLNYAKIVKHVNVTGIYYGAFEARANQDDIAQVYDLSDLDELLDWSQAINAFVRYGNAGHLHQLSINEIKHKLTNNNDTKKIRNFVNSLKSFNDAINTSRGKYIKYKIEDEKKSIAVAFNKMYSQLKEIKEGKSLKALTPLLAVIEKSTENFNTYDNLKIGLAQIEWCIEKGLIQLGYTALDETLLTYACRLYGFDETGPERSNVVNFAITLKNRDISRERWRVSPENADKIEKLTSIIDEDFAKLCDKIKARRNDMNHFGYTPEVMNSNKLIDDLKKLYQEFKDYMQQKAGE